MQLYTKWQKVSMKKDTTKCCIIVPKVGVKCGTSFIYLFYFPLQGLITRHFVFQAFYIVISIKRINDHLKQNKNLKLGQFLLISIQSDITAQCNHQKSWDSLCMMWINKTQYNNLQMDCFHRQQFYELFPNPHGKYPLDSRVFRRVVNLAPPLFA